MDTNTNTAPWSGLCRELLELIAERLPKRVDLLHFRGVCTTWRSAVPPPPLHCSPHFSHKFPFPVGPNHALNPNRRGHYTLTESTIYCIEPLHRISNPWNTTKTWLVKVEESEPGKFRLKDPVSLLGFDPLPRNFPKVLNLLDYRVSEIGKIYGLEFVNLSKEIIETNFNELLSTMIKKVAVSSNSDDFSVMVVHYGGNLSVWKWDDKKWANIDYRGEGSHYNDVAYHKGKFYALDYTGVAITVDSSLKITKVAAPLQIICLGSFRYGGSISSFGGQFKYLVKSCGDLFLVDTYLHLAEAIGCGEDSDIDNNWPVLYKIYRLNEEEKEWVRVYSLGDREFFVGDEGSYSVSAKDFSGCKANSVYFNEVRFSGANDGFPGWDAGIFDLEHDSAGPLSAFPGYSKIFWPLPIWLKGKPCSSSRH